MNSKNKLRQRNTTSLIYTGVICFILFLMFGIYFAYMMIDYETSTGDAVVLNTNILMDFFNYLSNPKLVTPIDLTTLWLCLKYQVTKLWWMYASVAFFVFLSVTSNPRDEYRGMEHGSASWSDKYNEKDFKDKTGIPIGCDTYATINNPKGKYYSPHNLNEITIGGSGAGKSFRKIKPDIMQMFGSYIVTDPKGELYRDTAKFLKQNGYKIRVLNLLDIGLSNTYNPFAYMVEEQDVINIADLFMKNSAGDGEKEDFWVGAAQDLLVAIMVYLWKTPYELKTFGRVLRLVNSVRYKGGKIDPLCELARCLKKHAVDFPMDVTTVNWGSIQGTPEETLGSVCKTLSTRLRLWAVEAVDELTATDEMDFDSIGKEKTVIFMLTQVPRNPYKVLSNMFYSQLFERLMRVANRDCNGKLPLLVSCEIDEFANLGTIPNFGETLAVVRSHNIRICIVLQGLSQLKALYEKTWESIISNCSIFNFLGTNDQESKEYVSKKLGKTTVRVDSRSYNRGNQGGGSDSESYVQRDLLAPDEIPTVLRAKGKTKKYGGSCIVFIDEYKPFYLRKYDTVSHPIFKITGSSFPKGIPNNTYIEKEYAAIKEKRHTEHQQQLTDFFSRGKEEAEKDKAEYEAEQIALEEERQNELAAQYEADLFEAPYEKNEDVNPAMEKFPEAFEENTISDDFSENMNEEIEIISDEDYITEDFPESISVEEEFETVSDDVITDDFAESISNEEVIEEFSFDEEDEF